MRVFIVACFLLVGFWFSGCDAFQTDASSDSSDDDTPPDTTTDVTPFQVEIEATFTGIRTDLWWMEGDKLDFTVELDTSNASKNIAALRVENTAGELVGSGYSIEVDKLASRADSQLVAIFTASDGSVFKQVIPGFKLTFVPEDEWIVVGITLDTYGGKKKLIETDTEGKHEVVVTSLPTDRLTLSISTTPDRSRYYFVADDHPAADGNTFAPLLIDRGGQGKPQVAFSPRETKLESVAYTGVSPTEDLAWFQIGREGRALLSLAGLDGSNASLLTEVTCSSTWPGTFPCEGGGAFAAWGSDGKYLYTSISGKDAEARRVYNLTRFNIETGEKTRLMQTEPDGPWSVKALGYEADGLVPLSIGSWVEDGIIRSGWLDLSTNTMTVSHDYRHMSISPDGRFIVRLSRHGNLSGTSVKDRVTGKVRHLDLDHRLATTYIMPRPVRQ